MISITPTLSIDEKEIHLEFIRSSGPGGQNVNKVATAVQIYFDASNSPSLPNGIRERLLSLAGKRANSEGVIIIKASRFRTQERNRKDAVDRLVSLIQRASQEPKSRKKTTLPKSSKLRRLNDKHYRGKIKLHRNSVGIEED